MSRADGTPVNAVFGFTKMLMKLVEDTDADHIAVVFDRARKTFRSDIYPEYKAHRPPPPDDLVPQFALVREATRALNIAEVSMEGFEADDLIATYARQAREQGAEVTIVSSDKDLMQLVDKSVTMLDAMKNKTIGPDQVMEKFGVAPDRVIDVQALAGDSSDNIKGVPNIGVKKAAEWISEYGGISEIPVRNFQFAETTDSENIAEQMLAWRKGEERSQNSCMQEFGSWWRDLEKGKSRTIAKKDYDNLVQNISTISNYFLQHDYLNLVTQNYQIIKLPFTNQLNR